MGQYKINIKRADQADLLHVSSNLREEEADFARRFTSRTADRALINSYNQSIDKWCLTLDGEPVVIFGILNPEEGESVYSWMGATEKIKDAPFQIARKSKHVINELKYFYKTIVGFVDKKHEVSVKWHKFLGYNLEEKVTDNGDGYYIATLGGSDGC
jgi:hypothetical protein